MPSHEPLACIFSVILEGDGVAHAALASASSGDMAPERQDLLDGYAFLFPADVARFLANERPCCPILSFEIGVAANDRLGRPAGVGAGRGEMAGLDNEVTHR